MKKKLGIFLLVLLLAGGVAGGVYYFKFYKNNSTSSDENAVFVDSVGMLTGLTSASGTLNRFSGVVEPQKTVKVELASGLKVKETYVSVGQEVKVGTKLFSYDTDEAQNSITQLEIDIENYDISMESSKVQVQQLEKEKAKAKADDQLSYTTQIMTIENSIKRSEYEKKSKMAEMESLKKQVANAVVYSEQQGIIKSIKDPNASDSSSYYDDSSEDSSAFITIMATGDYRVKGQINEQNMMQISEGVPVLVYSRVDESLCWKGTISTIDRDNGSSSQSSNYYSSSDDSSMSNSTKYPFYIELDSSEGLMLGQHVYITLDEGQEDLPDGMWLDEYYLITDENGDVTPYVWAAGANDRLEIRELTLGEYDENLMKYEILDGLTAEDYIAFPEGELAEGMAVTRNVDQMNYSIDYGTDYGMDYDMDSDMDEWSEDEWLEDDGSEDEWSEEEWLDDDGSEEDGFEEEWSDEEEVMDNLDSAEWSEEDWGDEAEVWADDEE